MSYFYSCEEMGEGGSGGGGGGDKGLCQPVFYFTLFCFRNIPSGSEVERRVRSRFFRWWQALAGKKCGIQSDNEWEEEEEEDNNDEQWHFGWLRSYPSYIFNREFICVSDTLVSCRMDYIVVSTLIKTYAARLLPESCTCHTHGFWCLWDRHHFRRKSRYLFPQHILPRHLLTSTYNTRTGVLLITSNLSVITWHCWYWAFQVFSFIIGN